MQLILQYYVLNLKNDFFFQSGTVKKIKLFSYLKGF